MITTRRQKRTTMSCRRWAALPSRLLHHLACSKFHSKPCILSRAALKEVCTAVWQETAAADFVPADLVSRCAHV